ncbi:MATE family efflux transporter [uncultured Dubosiella sp.]|uniref:MATE family efflux transporter n=1 Tax=uncultured Dubosiella sp. TaxID=1937011 RepID=UPI00273097C3|nr:MATE family efflux transporter [uncultured Dubosiella sp.]
MESNALKTEPIATLLVRMAVPAICAQLVTLLYNLVDRVFIGQMENGTLAMAAIGICAPIVTIVTAFTNLFGRGGAPLAAMEMGKNQVKRAEQYINHSFFALVLVSLAITILVSLFKKPVLLAFGASDATLPFALDYLSIYIAGTFFVQLSVGMNDYITTQGFAKTAMTTTAIGAILNTLLDPLFIFGLGWGVRGAALATLLSQMASFLWAMRFLLGPKTRLRLSFRTFHAQSSIIQDILKLGASPFFMSLSEGVLVLCFNTQAYRLGGDVAVGAMAILFSMFQFLLLPVEGVTIGAQPILSYNYGAKQHERVRKTIRLTIQTTLFFTFVATALLVLFPRPVLAVFTRDPALIDLGSRLLPVYMAGCFGLGANSTFQQTYNALGAGGRSFFFAFFRKGILLVPLLYLLPALTNGGLVALMLAEPVSDALTTLVNALSFRGFVHQKLQPSSSHRSVLSFE